MFYLYNCSHSLSKWYLLFERTFMKLRHSMTNWNLVGKYLELINNLFGQRRHSTEFFNSFWFWLLILTLYHIGLSSLNCLKCVSCSQLKKAAQTTAWVDRKSSCFDVFCLNFLQQNVVKLFFPAVGQFIPKAW